MQLLAKSQQEQKQPPRYASSAISIPLIGGAKYLGGSYAFQVHPGLPNSEAGVAVRDDLGATLFLHAGLQLPISQIIAVSSFLPEPYEVLQPLFILVTSSEEGFTASFFDVNIHSTGDTEEDALENLKSLILDVYDRLEKTAPSALGPEPTRQLARLRSFLRISQ